MGLPVRGLNSNISTRICGSLFRKLMLGTPPSHPSEFKYFTPMHCLSFLLVFVAPAAVVLEFFLELVRVGAGEGAPRLRYVQLVDVHAVNFRTLRDQVDHRRAQYRWRGEDVPKGLLLARWRSGPAPPARLVALVLAEVNPVLPHVFDYAVDVGPEFL